jgi:hypothetical protein
MKRLSWLILVFALLSVVFFLGLIFFRSPFPPYPLLNYQDIFDLLTPLVLIPIYWVLYRRAATNDSPTGETVFMLLAAFWVLGQGMHLAANAINNLSESLARQGTLDITGTQIYQLAYFLDEHLSHYLWHFGVIGLAVLLVWREWRNPEEHTANWWLVLPAGILYGFLWFAIFLEGQTAVMGFPFAFLFGALLLILGRRRVCTHALTGFFFVASLVAILLLVVWVILYGFPPPEITAVGLI